jgi:hypothetical protein
MLPGYATGASATTCRASASLIVACLFGERGMVDTLIDERTKADATYMARRVSHPNLIVMKARCLRGAGTPRPPARDEALHDLSAPGGRSRARSGRGATDRSEDNVDAAASLASVIADSATFVQRREHTSAYGP